MPTEDKIQFGFGAGEVDERYGHRSDLTKYDIGVTIAQNFFVDPKGGLVNRAGTEYLSMLNQKASIRRFKGTETDVLMVFTEGRIRFMVEGEWVRGPVGFVPVTTIDRNGLVTLTSHGYFEGDLVQVAGCTTLTSLNGRFFYVQVIDANQFKLVDDTGDIPLILEVGDEFTASLDRIYALPTPYLEEDLDQLHTRQWKNEVRITHSNYDRAVLEFIAINTWTLTVPSVGSQVARPAQPAIVAPGTGPAAVVACFTAIDSDGNESLPSPYAWKYNFTNYTTTLGFIDIIGSPVPGAVKYRFYRSAVFADLNARGFQGVQMGYIGSADSPNFHDQNITPDFTRPPPEYFDPFALGAISYIDITAGGSGYSEDASIAVSGGGGSGFIGYPVVNRNGVVVGVRVVKGGSGYSSPVTVTISDGTGTGATATAVLGPTSGMSPALFSVFQQRGMYLSTVAFPETLWASIPGQFDSYPIGENNAAGGSYTLTLDSDTVKPIKHVVQLRNGLLLFTNSGVTQLRAESGRAVTADNALAEPQVYSGVGDAEPVALNLDVLYASRNSTSVYAMLYTEYTESFKLQEVSVLAPHLIGPGKRIKRFVAPSLPNNLVYMPREDGLMLCLTYLREQDVYAWTRFSTYGEFRDAVMLEEGDDSYTYLVCRRPIRGKWRWTIERTVERDDSFAENFFGVDCGGQVPLTLGQYEIFGEGSTGAVSLTSNGPAFAGVQLGDIVYYAGGKAEVTAKAGDSAITGTWLREPCKFVEESDTNQPVPAGPGDWSYATPVSEVTGLWHLEGEWLSANLDGSAYAGETALQVVNGRLALPQSATKIKVGLGYTCRFRTLPLTSNQLNIGGKMKRIYSVFPSMYLARGLAFGPDFDHLTEVKDGDFAEWGDDYALHTEVTEVLLNDQYQLQKYLCGQTIWPLPATVLGFTAELSSGDSG